MELYKLFCTKFPQQEMKINERLFTYRYYEHPTSDTTIILLVGGIGLSDLIYSHFMKFAKEHSVITFDYSKEYQTNDELIEAIYELMKALNKKAWFIGQSLGGFIGELIAVKHPDIVEGLVLSNIGCASEELSETAYDSLQDMIKSCKISFLMRKFYLMRPMSMG